MNDEAIQYLDGQLLGIQLVLGVLIAAHPDSAELAQRVDDLLDEHIARALGSPRSADAQVRGLEHARSALRMRRGT